MKSTAKTVSIVMIIMVFSRLLSFVSVSLYTTFFGKDDVYINIYSLAIQIPNIVFTVFGTALTTVVIPIFSGNLDAGNKTRAYRFADNAISLATVFTILLALVGMLIAPIIPLVTEFKTNGYDFAVTALRIMFPIMIFFALNYIFQGILQSLGKFNWPAFVSVPSSLIVIVYVLTLGKKFGVMGLLIATFIGLSTQALILIPPILKTDYRFRPSLNYRDEDIRKAVKLMIPVMIGTSAYPLNSLFNVIIAANLKNMVLILSFAQNLVSYAVLAFVFSVTAVIFPKFSVLAARGEMGEFKDSLVKVLTSIFYFLLPTSAGFILVRKELLNLVVGWGKFTPDAVNLASMLLALYAIGIIGTGVKEVVDRAFYALNDTKRPAMIGVIIMAVNISLSLLLLRIMGVYGIPLANSIAILTGAAVLVLMLRKKIGAFGGKKLAKVILKIALSCIIMAAVVLPLIWAVNRYTFGGGLVDWTVNLINWIIRFISPSFKITHLEIIKVLVDRTVKLMLPAAVGALVYFAATYILKVDEAVAVLNKVRAKVLKKK